MPMGVGLKTHYGDGRRRVANSCHGSVVPDRLPGAPLGCLRMWDRDHGLKPRPFGDECGMRAGAA